MRDGDSMDVKAGIVVQDKNGKTVRERVARGLGGVLQDIAKPKETNELKIPRAVRVRRMGGGDRG